MDSKESMDSKNQNQESGQFLWLLDQSSAQQNTQIPNRDNHLPNPNIIKKKKRTDSGIKLSEDIEGHIGFKDVEYLEAFVNSNDSTKQLTDNNSKKGLFLTNTSNPKNKSLKKKKKSNQKKTNSDSNKPKNGSKVTTTQKP